MRKLLVVGALIVSTLAPMAANAQGVPSGIAYGSSEGARRAGPVGGLVGGVVGGVIGGVDGVLGIRPEPLEQQPQLVAYAPPSHHYHATRHWLHRPRYHRPMRHRVAPHRRHR